jgi:hypothetical protein
MIPSELNFKIDVDTPFGNMTIQPQRTNNLLEQFFVTVRTSPVKGTM